MSHCRVPIAPVNGYINGNYSNTGRTNEGSQINFHCGGDSPVMTSTCTNGSWIPDPADLDCRKKKKKGIIVAIIMPIESLLIRIVMSLYIKVSQRVSLDFI